MKDKIHPKYVEATVQCACGFTYKTYSTREVIKVDICSQCHPFYTGKTKIIDSAGRVERYRTRVEKTKALAEGKTEAKKQPSKRTKRSAKQSK